MTALRFDGLRALLADLKRQLQEIAASRATVDETGRKRRRLAEEETDKAGRELRTSHEEQIRDFDERYAAANQEVEASQARELARIEERHAGEVAAKEEELSAKLREIEGRIGKERQKAIDEAQKKVAAKSAALAELESALVGLQGEAASLRQAIWNYGEGLGIALEAAAPAAASAEGAPEDMPGQVDAIAAAFRRRRREQRFHWARLGPHLVAGVVLLIITGFGVLAAAGPQQQNLQKAAALGGAAWALLVMLLLALRSAFRRRAGRLLQGLVQDVEDLQGRLKGHLAATKDRINAHEQKLVDELNAVVAAVEARHPEPAQARATFDAAVAALAKQRDERLATAHRAACSASEEMEAKFRAEKKELQDRQRAESERAAAERGRTFAQVDGERREGLDRLSGRWKRAVFGFVQIAEEARRLSLSNHVPWSNPQWKQPRLPDVFPAAVHLGDVRVDLKTLVEPPEGDPDFAYPGDGTVLLPMALSFPDQGSLFAHVGSESRDKALEALFGALTRILTGLPPGKAKFLIFDPVGLGQNLSALMHLADHDESLVGGRIWTETGHIERKLGELTEHIEKVIQKYLRNRHATIADYNREVGPMAEAYRFLIITDFPSGFSETAIDRLSSVISSGPRCGVHTLILHDRAQKIPSNLDIARLRRNGCVLESDARGLKIEDDVVPGAPLVMEDLPKPDELTALLHLVGRRSVESRRIEVPFETVTPKPGQEWTLTSESGIRVPVGRAAAERLQYLDLGRGTAQHALIAGKTGSGKSTLFRVAITNLASWYSPGEVEFYLIDFKKGVEFKVFASHELPHARVVAIESDREFGTSVLRRLDQEFVRRAELFRKAGVQDFAGYRAAPAAEHLPRTLLLIDEFQEFFTEEDSTAQDAALLLDRIVRQGRAFGVHVVLGTQTLGGAYSLAKATLGQMAVRIALQCNEADSALILSDDNSAARLLSRPGEAIYNDMSGMIEGNNPFQVVWLADEAEEKRLEAIHGRAKREGWKPREPMTVFEGNVPADLHRNGEWNRRLASGPPADPAERGRAWVGEANAIKGPTEVRFGRQGGSNLLVIGQQRESASAVIVSSILSLSSGHPPGEARFIVLDGSPADLRDSRGLPALEGLGRHPVEFPPYGQFQDALVELDAEVKARVERGGSDERPVFLVVFDLQRFRKLRQGDDFEFSDGDGAAPSPARALANVITEGPAVGVHTIVWCDSLNNLTRSFSRKTLKEFETRIVFQMSASDSSELIDSPAAGKLGLHRGLLVVETEGALEKFRPYALPDPERLAEIRAALGAPAARPR